MAKQVLTEAEAFEFTTLAGVRLELWGKTRSWSDEIKTGLVEKQVVKRAGALHQKVGSPPMRTEFKCDFSGKDATARYNALVDAILEEPEGFFTHPRLGNYPAVCEGVQAQEDPGEAIDAVDFSIRFAETGLHDPPKPSATAQAQSAEQLAASVPALTASGTSDISLAGVAMAARATGYLVAMQAAETGLGVLPDVDASLSALVASVTQLSTLGAPKAARRQAALAQAAAIEARNCLLAGRPPLIRYPVSQSISLGVLCQQLYGAQARIQQTEVLRLNRLPRPYAIPAGTLLLLSDPRAFV